MRKTSEPSFPAQKVQLRDDVARILEHICDFLQPEFVVSTSRKIKDNIAEIYSHDASKIDPSEVLYIGGKTLNLVCRLNLVRKGDSAVLDTVAIHVLDVAAHGVAEEFDLHLTEAYGINSKIVYGG